MNTTSHPAPTTVAALTSGLTVDVDGIGVVTVVDAEAPQGATLGTPRVRLSYTVAWCDGVFTQHLKATTPVRPA
jgi:hypothetical protein